MDKDKTINDAQLAKQYQRIRAIAQKLCQDDLPRYLSKEAFQTCGQKLGVMQNNTLVSTGL